MKSDCFFEGTHVYEQVNVCHGVRCQAIREGNSWTVRNRRDDGCRTPV